MNRFYETNTNLNDTNTLFDIFEFSGDIFNIRTHKFAVFFTSGDKFLSKIEYFIQLSSYTTQFFLNLLQIEIDAIIFF